MPSRICAVSFTDPSGVEHSVELAAESLYQAAALAVVEFRKNGLMGETAPPSTTFTVAVKAPQTEHRVTFGQLHDWIGGVARNPKEKAIKERLRSEIVRRPGA